MATFSEDATVQSWSCLDASNLEFDLMFKVHAAELGDDAPPRKSNEIVASDLLLFF